MSDFFCIFAGEFKNVIITDTLGGNIYERECDY